jgi:hypothetical protein
MPHHWARELVKLGHDVKLIPAQRVKAFLPRMKNDAQDAKAIERAVNDPEMRFVGVCSVEQQTVLMVFKARCQQAFKRYPLSACKKDPCLPLERSARRAMRVANASRSSIAGGRLLKPRLHRAAIWFLTKDTL